jgi:hypothetical protein
MEFSKEEMQMTINVQEKFNIFSSQGNVKQSGIGISFHLSQNGYHQENK